jgi:hypothetical protein
MSNSHGDLFTEIGKLVLAANSGQAIDLNATVKDLEQRYRKLGMTEETLMKVVSRSIGAISFSMARGNGSLQSRLEALRESKAAPKSEQELGIEEALTAALIEEGPVAEPKQKASEPAPAAAAPAAAVAANGSAANGGRRSRRASAKTAAAEASVAKSGKSPFPSGVRLAVIS